MRLEEALSGVAGGPPRPAWLSEVLMGAEPRPRTLAGSLGLEGQVNLLRCVPLPLHKEARLEGREGDHNSGSALCTSLNNGTPLPWWPQPPPPPFLTVEPFRHASSGLPPHQETHDLAWGVQGCGMDHRPLSILPPTDQ